ncbi:MAG TPA: AAA family ATPase, partial [Urbifossiella sp.]|nr:AAA family ATPase [Urbifossiella sp.]
MLTRASIRNFKSLRDVQVDLERFTILVGPNASGKSSILQAINLLCRANRTQNSHGISAQNVELEVSQAASWGSKDPVELLAEAGGSWFRY